jgi:EAL domain-containing protein (putative c-di-GMP-specific phosphodiesterase class I)/GGDEF domain-containing protein
MQTPISTAFIGPRFLGANLMRSPNILEFVEKPVAVRQKDDERSLAFLIVGPDSPTFHQLKLAVSSMRPLGDAIRIFSAHSTSEALEIVTRESHLAVILLDSKLAEGEGASFALVKEVRERGFTHARIIMHSAKLDTELDNALAEKYDIDDFRGKNFVSRRTIEMLVISAVRTYRQIISVNRYHRMLRRVAQTSAAMIDQTSIADCARVATHAAVNVLSGNSGFLCFQKEFEGFFANQRWYGVGCYETGRHPSRGEFGMIECALTRESHVFSKISTVFYIRLNDEQQAAAIYIDGAIPNDEATHRIIDILSVQIASAINKMRFVHQMEFLALHDEATGLPNRVAMERLIDQCISGHDKSGVVSIVSVETHAEVEASLDEDTASRMMKAIADRIVKTGATVGRLSPCQLVVLGESQGKALMPVPRSLCKPILVDGLHLPVNLTIGTCDLINAVSGHLAIRYARIALRDARRHSRGEVLDYDHGMRNAAADRLSMISDMKKSIDATGQFVIHYQPQFNMITGELIGVEALLRWRRNGTAVSPADFIPVAEATGLIREIGLFPIVEGIHQAAAWYREGHAMIVGINLSATQLGDHDVIDAIKHTLKETGVPPGLIEIELTETAATTIGKATSIIGQLRGLGLRIAIDDFGTGYSSLERLANLKFDRIKIDRHFVAKAPNSIPHHAVCQMAINLAHSLGCSVLAEGVETEQQAQLLIGMGCFEVQGFLYGMPMPADEVFLPQKKSALLKLGSLPLVQNSQQTLAC